MLIITSLFLAIGAFNGQNNLLFFAFGMAVSAVLLSGLIGGSALMGVRVERVSVRPVSVGAGGGVGGDGGEVGAVRYVVKNQNRFLPVFAVLIEELVESDEGLSVGKAQLIPALVPMIGAGEQVRVHASVRGSQSGVLRLRGLRIRSSMPFGLIEKRIDFELQSQLEIHPAVLPVRRASSRNEGRLKSSAPVPSKRLGGEDEFMGVREYVPGDSTRKIAWARSASHDSLVVRTNAMPRSDSVWIDVDPATENREELELVMAAAASYAAEQIRQGIAVGLSVEAWGMSLNPRPGRAQLTKILSSLACRRGNGVLNPGSRTGERVLVSARVGGDFAGRIIEATKPESWLAARVVLPEAMREEKRGRSKWSRFRLRIRDEQPEAPR